MLSHLSAVAGLKIPDDVAVIGEEAFSDCKLVREIVIPEGVTSIGKAAFTNCISEYPPKYEDVNLVSKYISSSSRLESLKHGLYQRDSAVVCTLRNIRMAYTALPLVFRAISVLPV